MNRRLSKGKDYALKVEKAQNYAKKHYTQKHRIMLKSIKLCKIEKIEKEQQQEKSRSASSSSRFLKAGNC